MSDSDSENGSPVKGLSGQASGLELKLSFLKNACPNVDAMVLQDTLRAHNWKVDWALETLTKEQKSKPVKHKLKAHHVMEDNSESDDDEFTGKGLVYDSDEEEDGPTDDNMTVDKKKVLKFFNEGGEQEMTGIQGCNKKKVSEILKLRPFEGWVDLVTKLQTSKGLNDEMGLGKTIQTIAFLAHLKERGDGGPHLIIVPSSTMENWRKELELWAPDIQIVTYWGSQDERRHLRLQLVQDELDYDVILTTYNM